MFLDAREAIHVALETLCRTKLANCDVERNSDAPVDWDAMTNDRKIIIRDGAFARPSVITGRTSWVFFPLIEGHVRANSAAELGVRSNTLLAEVCAALDDNLTLAGACDDLDYEMEETPDLNTEPEAGSLLAWQLKVAAELEERTQA